MTIIKAIEKVIAGVGRCRLWDPYHCPAFFTAEPLSLGVVSNPVLFVTRSAAEIDRHPALSSLALALHQAANRDEQPSVCAVFLFQYRQVQDDLHAHKFSGGNTESSRREDLEELRTLEKE